MNLELDEKELADALRSRVSTALSASIVEAKQKGQELAAQRLRKGLKHWERGFNVHKVDKSFYILSVEGKLSNWMEDGIQPGEISKSIMSGNRINSNKKTGKNYVDVPIAKDADSMGNIGSSGVNVTHFADADAMLKHVKFSDYKKKGIRTENRIVRRVEDIIQSTKPKTNKMQYLTIRRVTSDSIWPKTPFSGARVLEDLGIFIEQNFDKLLERFI